MSDQNVVCNWDNATTMVGVDYVLHSRGGTMWISSRAKDVDGKYWYATDAVPESHDLLHQALVRTKGVVLPEKEKYTYFDSLHYKYHEDIFKRAGFPLTEKQEKMFGWDNGDFEKVKEK